MGLFRPECGLCATRARAAAEALFFTLDPTVGSRHALTCALDSIGPNAAAKRSTSNGAGALCSIAASCFNLAVAAAADLVPPAGAPSASTPLPAPLALAGSSVATTPLPLLLSSSSGRISSISWPTASFRLVVSCRTSCSSSAESIVFNCTSNCRTWAHRNGSLVTVRSTAKRQRPSSSSV